MRLVAVVAALVAVVPVGASQPAPQVGQIVYEAGNDMPSQGIRIVRGDGTQDRQLGAPLFVGPSVFAVHRPEISPRGDLVVYVRYEHVRAGSARTRSMLYVVSTRGAPRPRLLGRGDWPAWSRDGRRIAFKRGAALYVADARGRGARRLAPAARNAFYRYVFDVDRVDAAPSWSADGRSITYANGGEVWIVDVATAERRRLTRSRLADAAPEWSPDGRWIAWVCGVNVCVSRPDATRRRAISSLRGSRAAVVHWSPQRSRDQLAFTAVEDGTGHVETYVATLRGRPVRVDSHERTSDPDFAWSPDGRRLAFAKLTLVARGPGREYQRPLWSVSLTGAAPRALTSASGRRPRWVGPRG